MNAMQQNINQTLNTIKTLIRTLEIKFNTFVVRPYLVNPHESQKSFNFVSHSHINSKKKISFIPSTQNVIQYEFFFNFPLIIYSTEVIKWNKIISLLQPNLKSECKKFLHPTKDRFAWRKTKFSENLEKMLIECWNLIVKVWNFFWIKLLYSITRKYCIKIWIEVELIWVDAFCLCCEDGWVSILKFSSRFFIISEIFSLSWASIEQIFYEN